jgi:hypothetical protein
MLQKRLAWLTKCLLFSLLGIFVGGQVSNLFNPIIWWALHHSGTTFLQRRSFIAAYYPPLIGIYGFCLGLVPLHRLQELLASTFGRFRFTSNHRPELSFDRPLLWAWVPVGLGFAYRLLTFKVGRDHNVLGSMTYGQSRYEHFFASLQVQSTPDWAPWVFDRFVLTGPALFLLAYTAGVWLRHQFPQPPVSADEVQ